MLYGGQICYNMLSGYDVYVIVIEYVGIQHIYNVAYIFIMLRLFTLSIKIITFSSVVMYISPEFRR